MSIQQSHVTGLFDCHGDRVMVHMEVMATLTKCWIQRKQSLKKWLKTQGKDFIKFNVKILKYAPDFRKSNWKKGDVTAISACVICRRNDKNTSKIQIYPSLMRWHPDKAASQNLNNYSWAVISYKAATFPHVSLARIPSSIDTLASWYSIIFACTADTKGWFQELGIFVEVNKSDVSVQVPVETDRQFDMQWCKWL